MADPDHEMVAKKGAKSIDVWQKENPGTCLDLSWSDLSGINLSESNLMQADLTGANISRADLTGSDLQYANLSKAIARSTLWADLNLSQVIGLESIDHLGPSYLGMDTLAKSAGRLPKEFLSGCGLTAWEIEVAQLYDHHISKDVVVENIMNAYKKRTLFFGGVYIFYSQVDSPLADKLYKHFKELEIPCWQDKYGFLAGEKSNQIFNPIRLQDVVVLILSKNSIENDWVEAVIKAAEKRHRYSGWLYDDDVDDFIEPGGWRDVLCPIAIDETWKEKITDDENKVWYEITRKPVLDFSSWETDAFDSLFTKLIEDMRINYTGDNELSQASVRVICVTRSLFIFLV